jgi:subtilase family serine protease
MDRSHLSLVSLATLTVALAACSSAGTVPTAQQPSSAASAQTTSQFREPLDYKGFPIALHGFPIQLHGFPIQLHAFPICAQQKNNKTALCHVNLNVDIAPIPDPNLKPASIPGLQPAQLQQRYLGNANLLTGGGPPSGVSKAKGAGQTIALITAFTSPNAESDLAVFRTAFGLPACTRSNGCFSVVGQGGNAVSQSVWPEEAAIDIEMASAMCPLCHIMLVQAQDDSIDSLVAAEDLAVASGATVISNSWSLPESPGALAYASHFNHPGVPITAGAGDGGFGVGFPADLTTVTAVGGTTFDGKSNESIWGLSGSGCSTLVAKPSWQIDNGCAGRTVNDIAVVGDPATGVAVYSKDAGGWAVFGGTSVGAPIIAAMYALNGDTRTVNDASEIYAAGGGAFNHITSGSNGSCSVPYLCSGAVDVGGLAGYNAPAGRGSPHNATAF